MGNFPAAKPSADNAYIIGELYELKEGADLSWALEQLDGYEGVEPEEGELPLYVREVTTVFYKNQITDAYIYWFNASVEGQPAIPSGDIFQFVEQKSKL